MRKRLSGVEAKRVRYFDHERSALVDVIPNAEGEFVQVWDHPRGFPERRVALAYQRTPHGPTEVSSWIRLNEGRWDAVETTGPRRTFYYRGSFDIRYEELLPSGRILVDDAPAGLRIGEEWTTEFNWAARLPSGKRLGPRLFNARRDSGLSYFVSSFQEHWDATVLVKRALMLVEEHRSGNPVARTEIMPEAEA